VLAHLSYRYKTPLSLSLVILLTALVISGALLKGGLDAARRNLSDNAANLALALARALKTPMLRDDVWQAYETVMSAIEGGSGRPPDKTVIIVDQHLRIFVASDPRRLRMQAYLADSESRYGAVLKRLAPLMRADANRAEEEDGQYIYVLAPVRADDFSRLGFVILEYSRSLYEQAFLDSLKSVLLSTALVLAVLLPLGWYWGNRLAQPLAHLADCMARVGREPLSNLQCDLPSSKDEIGLLASRFKVMLQELEQKATLEKQMVAAERLATVGRLASGIAHEINNPLGGMLNAISNQRLRGEPDSSTAKTLSLLERGLNQIRDTVGALLVEARLESHAVTCRDWEDLRTLVQPQVEKRNVRLAWECEVEQALPLPSTPVRQILLNLLLNAVQAAETCVACRIVPQDGLLKLEVSNDGAAISPEKQEHLYEPFYGGGEGHGLGLWITYQLVKQLHGEIAARSDPNLTIFTVQLPLERGHDG
jgi:two-component system, NtrC family, sensor kinase